MKSILFDQTGKKKSDISLPKDFSTKIREDIVMKVAEVEKFLKAQPYTHDPRAGRKHSAAGTISHKRHDWKGHYGRGISRTPRKTMWRRGTQFYWIGAEISSARGGRRVHGPTLFKRIRKINLKEIDLAFKSALAATNSPEYISKRYSSIDSNNKYSLGVVESLPEKSKELITLVESIFPEAENVIFKKKETRSGKGKRRGRKYKTSAGALIIIADDESSKIKSGFDIIKLSELSILDLYPLGRLTLITKKALDSIENKNKEQKK